MIWPRSSCQYRSSEEGVVCHGHITPSRWIQPPGGMVWVTRGEAAARVWPFSAYYASRHLRNKRELIMASGFTFVAQVVPGEKKGGQRRCRVGRRTSKLASDRKYLRRGFGVKESLPPTQGSKGVTPSRGLLRGSNFSHSSSKKSRRDSCILSYIPVRGTGPPMIALTACILQWSCQDFL